jgi:phage terminase large subunit-like protein
MTTRSKHKAGNLILDDTLALFGGAKKRVKKILEVPESFEEFAKLCRIRSGAKIVPFKLYDYQKELVDLSAKYKGIVVFKTRQLGVTETIACRMLHKTCLNPSYLAAVLSLGQVEASNVAKRIRLMPAKIKDFGFASNSLTNLEINGGGRLIFRPSTRNAIRSLESLSDLLFDEAAFTPNIEEIYSSAVPATEMVGDAARIIIASTISDEGKLSWFWSMFSGYTPPQIDIDEKIGKIQDGTGQPFDYWIDEQGWCKVLLHWRAHPYYSSIPNYLSKIKEEKRLTEIKLQREYNLGIPEVGVTLFPSQYVAACAVGKFAPPKAGRRYLFGIDPNFGGSDYFVCLVWDVTEKPYQLVSQYRDAGRSSEISLLRVQHLIEAYKPTLVAVEKNSGGQVILENLNRACPGTRFAGTLTSASSKITNTDRLAVALETREVVFPPDWEGIQEMLNFSLLTRKGIGQTKDDCIMAWAAAWAHLGDVGKVSAGALLSGF